jgi:Transposase DDE domain
MQGFESSAEDNTSSRGSKAAAEREKKARLEQRRQDEQTETFRKIYNQRAGIEGLNRRVDVETDNKKLRVRGLAAVSHAPNSKPCGWNILQVAKRKAKAARAERRKARMGARKARLQPIGVLIKWLIDPIQALAKLLGYPQLS